MKKLDSVKILGVSITNAFQEDILEYIVEFLEKSTEKGYIVTPNPEILVHADKHKDFQQVLNNAEISLADGVGLIVAGQLLKTPLKSRVTGVEMLENLCKAISDRPITVGFLGGKQGVAEETSKCLVEKFPNLRVTFAVSELSDLEAKSGEVSSSKYQVLGIQKKNPSILNTKYIIPDTDILFVAFGFPKQEEFMAKNIDKLPVRLMMGVGGAFDYISGRVPRAPKAIRSVGLEWLFRLAIQPWRLKRQLALGEFGWLVLKERIKI